MSSCALSMSVERGTVFRSTRSIPTFAASFSNTLLAYKVKRIIGILGKICLNTGATSKPFRPDIERSKITTSGLIRLASSMASFPFSASPHLLKPSDRKAVASIFRIGAWSSTTKTVLPNPRLRGSLSTSKRLSFSGAKNSASLRASHRESYGQSGISRKLHRMVRDVFLLTKSRCHPRSILALFALH